MSDSEKYPSGGNYPETKEDWAEHFVKLLESASPDQLKSATQKWLHSDNPKFILLGKALTGFMTLDKLDRHLGEIKKGKGQ